MENKDTKLEWIPLDSQLPEVGKPVLGLNAETGDVNVIYMRNVGSLSEFSSNLIDLTKQWSLVKSSIHRLFSVKTYLDTFYGREEVYHPVIITHWIPLPELPTP